MKNFIKIFYLCILCISIGYGATSADPADPSNYIGANFDGSNPSFKNYDASVKTWLNSHTKGADFLAHNFEYASNFGEAKNNKKPLILDAYKKWYDDQKKREAEINLAGTTGIVDAKELAEIQENKKIAQVVRDNLGVSDVNNAKTNIEALKKAQDENTNLKVIQAAKGIDQTVLENAIKDPDIQSKIALAQKNNLQGSATATNINELGKLKDGEYIFKTNADKSVEIYKQEGGNLIPSGIKFTDIDSAKKFESVRDVMIGKINIDLVTRLDANIKNIFTKQETRNLINDLRNKKVKTEDLLVVLQGNQAILQENGKDLYKGSFQEVILVKLAYSMLSALESSSFFSVGGNNPLAITEKSNAELEEIHKLLGVKNQEDALKILQQQQKDSLLIKDINKTLGASSLQESLENLSKMGDLSKKLQEIKNEANNLKDSMTALPANFNSFSDATKGILHSFVTVMKEQMDNASNSAGGLQADLKEASQIHQESLTLIEKNEIEHIDAKLSRLHDIANKYKVVKSDKLKATITQLLKKNDKDILEIIKNEEAKKIRDKEKKEQYQKEFDGLTEEKKQKLCIDWKKKNYTLNVEDIYFSAIYGDTGDGKVVDEDPLSSALSMVEFFKTQFEGICNFSKNAAKDSMNVNALFLAKKNELLEKIEKKNKENYDNYLNNYKELISKPFNSAYKPSIVDFMVAGHSSIFLLDNFKNNKFFKIDTILEDLVYLKIDEKKSMFVYLLDLVKNFELYSKEYEFRALRRPNLKISDLDKLFVQLKNSIQKNEAPKSMPNPSKLSSNDYQNFFEELSHLQNGKMRKQSLERKIVEICELMTKEIGNGRLNLKFIDTKNSDFQDLINYFDNIIKKTNDIKVHELNNFIDYMKEFYETFSKNPKFVTNVIKNTEGESIQSVLKQIETKLLSLLNDSEINDFEAYSNYHGQNNLSVQYKSIKKDPPVPVVSNIQQKQPVVTQEVLKQNPSQSTKRELTKEEKEKKERIAKANLEKSEKEKKEALENYYIYKQYFKTPEGLTLAKKTDEDDFEKMEERFMTALKEGPASAIAIRSLRQLSTKYPLSDEKKRGFIALAEEEKKVVQVQTQNIQQPMQQGEPPQQQQQGVGNTPQAPNLLGNTPQAPNLLGNTPQAPNLLGNTPQAPNLLTQQQGGGNTGGPPPLNLLIQQQK